MNTPTTSSVPSIVAKFPRLTFLHPVGFGGTEGLDLTYSLCAALLEGNVAQDLVPIAFREPLADCVRTLTSPFPGAAGVDQELLNPGNKMADGPIFPGTRVSPRSILQSMERVIATDLRPAFLGKFANLLLAGSLRARSRFLFWDANRTPWLQEACAGFAFDDCLVLTLTGRNALNPIKFPFKFPFAQQVSVPLDQAAGVISHIEAIHSALVSHPL